MTTDDRRPPPDRSWVKWEPWLTLTDKLEVASHLLLALAALVVVVVVLIEVIP